MQVAVFGASDDLIELEGSIREEFSPSDADEPTYLAFSDGTVLSVLYAKDGCWRVNRVAIGTAQYEKVEAKGDDSPDYSDRATLTGDLRWVVLGTQLVKAK